MNVSQIMIKMVNYSDGNLHDINHFMKVYALARTIGQQEGLDEQSQTVLEVAAILHDIACPLCREKYSRADGKDQEREGMPLARDFLKDSGLPTEMVERVVWLVGHHHTVTEVDGLDHQILLEADYLVNAHESAYSREQIDRAAKVLFQTEAGRDLLAAMYIR